MIRRWAIYESEVNINFANIDNNDDKLINK